MTQKNGEAAFGSMNRGPKEILFPKRAKSSIHNGSAQERERLEQETIDHVKPSIDWAAVAQWAKEQPLIVETDPPSDEMPAWVRGPSWTEILAMSNLTPQDYWNAILEAKRLGLKISACANLIFWRSELDAANLSPYACRVLCELSKRANGKEDGAFPSYTTIEKACGISRPTVRRALRELELAGLIRVKRTWGKQNRYTVVSLEEWLEWRTAKKLPIPPPQLGSDVNQLTTDPGLTSKPQTLPQLTTLTGLVNDVNSKEIPLKRSH
jgi:DNA-binding MarR family transcriptional regulator